MLRPNGLSGYNFIYDNWGANPASTIGTSVIPGVSDALGSWTQVASSAQISEDCYWIYLQVHTGMLTAVAKQHLLDIGVDPAGGTAYSPIISNLVCGCSPALTQAGNREFCFPFFIKKGSSVAVRIRGSHTVAGTVRVPMRFYGKPSAPENVPVGMFSETLGAITGSLGQSITPGNATDGSWVDLGAITQNMWWWQLGYQINNTTITAEYTYLEVARGDASNKHTIFKMMHGGTTSETCGLSAQTHLLAAAAYNQVAAGEHIYVRARCNNAPDTGYNVCVVGIGG